MEKKGFLLCDGILTIIRESKVYALVKISHFPKPYEGPSLAPGPYVHLPRFRGY